MIDDQGKRPEKNSGIEGTNVLTQHGGEVMDENQMFQPFPFDITLKPTAEQIRSLETAQHAIDASQSMQFEIVHGIVEDMECDYQVNTVSATAE